MNDFLKIVSLEIKLQGIAQLLYFSLCYKFRTTLLKLYLLFVCLLFSKNMQQTMGLPNNDG